MRRFLMYVGLAACVTLGDYISKLKILAHFEHAHPPTEITSFFNLVLVHNRGVSFGIFNHGGKIAPVLLTLFAALVIVFLLLWLWRVTSRLQAFALSLLIGGALGNVIDRLIRGAVVDFLDFHAFGYHYPAFNLADSAVVCGVALLLVQGLVFDKKTRQQS